jgi:CRP/FNR family transcriptional regulator, anaerobic regulatory protein
MFHDIELQREFEKHAHLRLIEADQTLMETGRYIKFIPIIKSGCIRVLRQNEDGNETFLYHLMGGETCAVSLTCCSIQRLSEVKAVAEEDTELWTIPIQYLEEWQKYREWREFIGMTYQKRFNRLLEVIDQIAFENLDQRLWNYLKARAQAQNTQVLNISHEQIAQELNIQRESATRLIKKLKQLEYIEAGRNQIRILRKIL